MFMVSVDGVSVVGDSSESGGVGDDVGSDADIGTGTTFCISGIYYRRVTDCASLQACAQFA